MIILFLLMLLSLRSQIRDRGQTHTDPTLIKSNSSSSSSGNHRRDDDHDRDMIQ